MEEATFIQILLGLLSGISIIASAVLGWLARQLWDAVQSLKMEVNDLRVLIGTDYVRYDRLQDALKPILEIVQEIKETLKTKVDKP